MKIYVCHSTAFDYKTELYEPLKRELSGLHKITLPHESGADFNSKSTIQNSDLVLAEVSFPSTGQGIELGWAESAGVPIICIYKSNTKPSQALRHIAQSVVSYSDEDDLLHTLSEVLR